jgi:hypothetical protein
MLSLTAAIATIILFISWIRSQALKRSKLPPGPPPWPIIGNLLDMPTSFEWFQYKEWGKKYRIVLIPEFVVSYWFYSRGWHDLSQHYGNDRDCGQHSRSCSGFVREEVVDLLQQVCIVTVRIKRVHCASVSEYNYPCWTSCMPQMTTCDMVTRPD